MTTKGKLGLGHLGKRGKAFAWSDDKTWPQHDARAAFLARGGKINVITLDMAAASSRTLYLRNEKPARPHHRKHRGTRETELLKLAADIEKLQPKA